MKMINIFGVVYFIIILIVTLFPGHFDNSTNAWVKVIAIMIATRYAME